jgi:capsular polysaccharide biosynthesis protein
MDPFLEEEVESGGGLDPLRLVRQFWRRKWLFIVPFVLCVSVATYAIKTMTPLYESDAQIRVIHDRSTSHLIDDDNRRVSARDRGRETMAGIWALATAPRFVESIVLETRLYEGSARMPEDVPAEDAKVLTPDELRAVRAMGATLTKNLRIRQDGYQIFSIGVRDADPRQAFILTRVLLDRFLEEDRASRVNPRATTRDFLARRRAGYAEALAAAEDSLTRFQRTLVVETLAGNPVNASNIAAAELAVARLKDTHYNADVNEMARLEVQAKATVGELPDHRTFMTEHAIAALLPELRSLELDRLLGVGDPNLGDDLGQLRLQLNDLVDQRLSVTYPQISVIERNRVTQYVYFMIYREGRGRVLKDFERHIADYKEFTTRQPVQSSRLAELQAEVTRRRVMLEDIDEEIDQQEINLEASRSEIGYRIEVRRDPLLRWDPVEPDKRKLFVMAVALSLAIGIGLVVLSIMLDRTFTSVDEIERGLRLKVIGTMPVIQDDHFQRHRRLRVLRWVVLVVGVLGVAAVLLLYVYPRVS